MTAAPPRTLPQKQQETWQAYLDATRLLLDELDRRVNQDAGISLADFGVLARLSDADEWGLRMSELADSTVSSRSRMSHAVDRLETLGLVERRACPTDRRGSYASLTEAGRQKLIEALPGHSETVRRYLFDQLSEAEVDEFRVSMTAVKTSLQQQADPR
jgi:DNA-binding MarR family transcriptional regulator